MKTVNIKDNEFAIVFTFLKIRVTGENEEWRNFDFNQEIKI